MNILQTPTVSQLTTYGLYLSSWRCCTVSYYRPILTDPINLVILSGYSDLSVEQYVKSYSELSDIHHFVSHCKMAPQAQGGVIDGETRVYGTSNVYVGDNATCPVIPDINTTEPAMMIGLRTSEILKRILPDKRRCCRCSRRRRLLKPKKSASGLGQ